MDRFSQSLEDKQSNNREKRYEQLKDNHHYYSHEERQPHVAHVPKEEQIYRQAPNPEYKRPVYQKQDNFYKPVQNVGSDEIAFERPVIVWESIKPDYS